MSVDIREQYNEFPEAFSNNQKTQNQKSREMAYAIIQEDLTNSFTLDLCCGDGDDSVYFEQNGAKVIGIDASKEMIDLARKNNPNIKFDVGLAESLPYEDSLFDNVFSKYAIMTSADMKPIFSEVHRVLKPGGIFVYLVTHPIRQYLEKKDAKADYFKQEIVDSVILDATVTVHEPTHTFTEYFNKDFFDKFELLDYQEAFDPAAEQINGAVYPGFVVIKARKK